MECPFYFNPAIDHIDTPCVYLDGRNCKDIEICPQNSDAWCVEMVNKAIASQLNAAPDSEGRVICEKCGKTIEKPFCFVDCLPF